jgi:hypothetical protein
LEPVAEKTALYLADYELLGHRETGLSLIESLNLGSRAVLVTSRFEEEHVRAGCERLGVRLIPKSMAGFVPISFAQKLERPDCILIDDDILLIHPIWRSAAKSKGLNIKLFSTPHEFLSVVDTIDRLTPIYIDVSLGNGVKGTDFAVELHKLGFTEINLATGYEPDSIQAPPFIRRIVGKDFPELS